MELQSRIILCTFHIWPNSTANGPQCKEVQSIF